MPLATDRLVRDEEEQQLRNTAKLDSWLRELITQGGSDLLLVPAAPPCIRFEGEVKRIGDQPLSGTDIEDAVLPALTSRAAEIFRQDQITDASYRVEGLGRFRINLHRERGLAAAAMRALPSKLPTFRDLNLPPGITALAPLSRGLVLVGGAAGAGKIGRAHV